MVDRSARIPLLSGGLEATVGDIVDLADASLDESVIKNATVGGMTQVIGGDGSPGYAGGTARVSGGFDGGNGPGDGLLAGADAQTAAIGGGSAIVRGGAGGPTSGPGGAVELEMGAGTGSGRAGHLVIVNATNTPGAATGTLTNAPKAGNPQMWLEVLIDGTTYYIPAWHT